jgi:hypothetical protein
MVATVEDKLRELYDEYNISIKPLIALLEARIQKFPPEILKEVRAIHDHVARCYMFPHSEDEWLSEIRSAKTHNMRIMLDCFKHLNVVMFDSLANFEKREMKHVNLSLVNNGLFFKEFHTLKQKATQHSYEARKLESYDKNKALELYEKMLETYIEAEKLIADNKENIVWAKGKIKKHRITDIAISSIISLLIGYFGYKFFDKIFDCIRALF